MDNLRAIALCLAIAVVGAIAASCALLPTKPRFPVDGKLAICTMFTMDYEGPYLLPWLAYHRLIGFDHVLLYLDDCDGTARARHRGIFKPLVGLHWVRVVSKCEAGTQSHMEVLRHCEAVARGLGATWVVNWDVGMPIWESSPRQMKA